MCRLVGLRICVVDFHIRWVSLDFRSKLKAFRQNIRKTMKVGLHLARGAPSKAHPRATLQSQDLPRPIQPTKAHRWLASHHLCTARQIQGPPQKTKQNAYGRRHLNNKNQYTNIKMVSLSSVLSKQKSCISQNVSDGGPWNLRGGPSYSYGEP